MSTPGVAAHGDHTKIGRQSVHDREGVVVGYELLFRARPGLEAADEQTRDLSTSEAICTAFGEFRLHRLGARRNLYVNMTRGLLTGAVPMPFGPHNVVLEILEHIEVDAELLDGVQALKYRGYRLAIDGYVGGPEHPRLLGLVDVVKLDVPAIGPDLWEMSAYLRGAVPQARLMADGVQDEAGLDACRSAGFELFLGPLYQRTAGPAASDINPSQTISLQLLAALSDMDSTIDELERMVSADPGLSLRVLSAVNSAAGAGQQIRSLRQAIVLMGRRSLSGWVMLAALGGHPDQRREDMIDILTRARICELLSPCLDGVESSTAYAAGLLSGLVEVMGADPEQLARRARMDEEVTSALVARQGQVGALLDAIDEFDRTGQTDSLIPAADMSWAHLHALGTAVATVDSILGQPGEAPGPDEPQDPSVESASLAV
jgi:EAL and modified HD-GYP domain-containing signal transduction protein